MKRVYTIPCDEPFLEVLARAVLAGFPDGPTELARVRILVPTRRAARECQSCSKLNGPDAVACVCGGTVTPCAAPHTLPTA